MVPWANHEYSVVSDASTNVKLPIKSDAVADAFEVLRCPAQDELQHSLLRVQSYEYLGEWPISG